MSFTYTRTIRFQDTDAAGVVYFANVLAMCHEAYEESLIASDINLKLFFGNPNVAIPIVHASVDFFSPMFCGDKVIIQLIPQHLSSEKVEVNYQFIAENRVVAQAITRHVCIDSATRSRKEIPAEMIRWLQQWKEEEA
ncbi:thioesterase family protein [Coleofasciculus sp. FACHB-1120]|uniref:acyl-CoA thioesterase n=1 Tax=Coleofasciculus sp. FACHB-1120 TaxID=2692783 RepID=UPI0016822B55|nr:thioesterase family protein [Coleofasciculus sp. FACHB-1120]MBD2741385.1 acyl-CoA thioesterase [Coleofasciculus sp. FACHB-1120]